MGLPYFIDIEASSLGPASYPIEIGWSDAQARVHSLLIRPDAYWLDVGEWSPESEYLHGLSLDLLLSEGVSPMEAWSRLIEVCGRDATLYSDAVDFDRMWLAELAASADDELGAMRLSPASELIHASEPSPYLDALLYRARTQLGLRQHRAAEDVRALLCAYLANQRYLGLGELTHPMPDVRKLERLQQLVTDGIKSGVGTRTMAELLMQARDLGEDDDVERQD
ncbi:hypothetical protein H0Z60_12310 [Ectothiorhodospiraceae bacterium WFHF3C12]|nr:hypothetical protein [Ectothiorhodospiraceae bacterium WFHF3C12]